MARYTAGFNMAGYLPEVDPVEVDTFEEARDYILSELDEHLSIIDFTLDSAPEESLEEDVELMEEAETRKAINYAKEAVASWDSAPATIQVSHWVYWIQGSEN